MAFTDLDEHLAEAFGSQWDPSDTHSTKRPSKPEAEKYSPEALERRRAHGRDMKRQRRLATRLEWLRTGYIASRCQRDGCCNLLPPASPETPRTCSAVCRTTLWRQNRK